MQIKKQNRYVIFKFPVMCNLLPEIVAYYRSRDKWQNIIFEWPKILRTFVAAAKVRFKKCEHFIMKLLPINLKFLRE